ncbi:Uncharacterized protein APZ42_009794, partial [Daphnia magna]
FISSSVGERDEDATASTEFWPFNMAVDPDGVLRPRRTPFKFNNHRNRRRFIKYVQ